MRKRLTNCIAPLIVATLLPLPLYHHDVSAFLGTATKTVSGIAKFSASAHTLPDTEIIRLSRIAEKNGGTAIIGAELGKLNLPDDVLEDTFMRIAVLQQKIPQSQAETMFSRLTTTPGFRTTLRKIIGNSPAGTAGHLHELRMADEAAKRGFKVRAIGESFSDGMKKAPSDIDLILERGGRTFAVEVKHYSATTRMPLDSYRADLDTLVAFRETSSQNVALIFSFATRPDDLRYLHALEHEAQKRNVELIFGGEKSSLEQIQMLGAIM